MRLRLSLALALTLALAGCAPKQLVAPTGDWAAYRSTRVARGAGDRLAAAVRYLERYPDGDFAEEVRARFEKDEPAYYARSARDARGLWAYLTALPSGPHAAEARDKLEEARLRSARPDALVAMAKATSARLAQAQRERDAVRETFVRWLGAVTDPELYARPVSEAPASFIVGWALAVPEPRCELTGAWRRCFKGQSLPFTIPTREGQEPREATVAITLEEDATGRPVRVVLSGPDLFVRLEEARRIKVLDSTDPSVRLAAITTVVELLRDATRQHGLSPACLAPGVAPVVLEGQCGALHIELRSRTDESPDDVVRVEVR